MINTPTKLLASRHVLIVEDERRFSALWSQYLQRFGGASTDIATSVRQAKQLIGMGDTLEKPPTRPHAMLIDFQPHGDRTGSQFADDLRQHPAYIHIVRISISGRSRDEILDGMADSDMLYHAFISKLITPPELIMIIHRLLDSAPASR